MHYPCEWDYLKLVNVLTYLDYLIMEDVSRKLNCRITLACYKLNHILWYIYVDGSERMSSYDLYSASPVVWKRAIDIQQIS